jgi:hypothetical protein
MWWIFGKEDYTRFMHMKSRTFLIVGILILWLISMTTKFKYNGLIYGLDFGLFHPDGQLYTFKTLTLLGKSELEAGTLVSDWYSTHAFKLRFFEPTSLYFDIHPLWQLYKPRVLYPILSVPFVAIFGIPGMLVVPALSMLVLLVSVFLIGIKVGNEKLAFVLVLMISISPVVNRWMFANITDGLLTAITCIFLVSLLYIQKPNLFLFVGSVLILLASLTRTSVLQWLAICVGIYFMNQKKNALVLGFTSVMMFIPSAIGNLETGVLPNEKPSSFFERPVQLLFSMVKVAFFEIGQLLVLDRILLCLLVLAIIASVLNFSRISSKFFLLLLISLWITGAVNGTIGVNFRYQLPLLPFIAYSLLDSFRLKFEFIKFATGPHRVRNLKG